MFDHVMIDLETLDNKPTSAIVSIGAVKFDPKFGKLGDTFYRVVEIESALKFGTASGSTIKWWMKQSDAARDVFNMTTLENVSDLPTALRDFSDWLARTGQDFDYKVWGNGASFDNTILRHAYEQTGIPAPWQFWNDRCYRTFKGMWPQIKMTKRTGTHHNALDDAISQADHLSEILRKLP